MIRPLLPMLLCLTLAQATSATMKAWPIEMIDDADLHDVCYAGPNQVWAVGDRGGVWLSNDGGSTWDLQPPLTTATLSSVSFASHQTPDGNSVGGKAVGLIVGGTAQPHDLPSLGVVLRSIDGGTTWKPLEHQLVPALSHVDMEDARSGTAVGDVWAMFPSALFRTKDGGRSWSSGPGRVSAAWADADFGIPNRPLLVSRSGNVVAVTRTTMGLPQNDTHHIRAARWMADGTALAVGDDGAVLVSRDRGQTWQDHRSALPPGLANQFDFLAMKVIGPRVWIAGSPGTLILRSADAGRTWSAVRTAQTLPIHAIDFGPPSNESAGLSGTAVGALGLRLSTGDAGTHWSLGDRQPRRAGALMVAARPTAVPLDLIAHLSASGGLRTRVVVLESDEAQLVALEEAVKTVGGDGVTVIHGFPVPPIELMRSAADIQEQWREQQALQVTATGNNRHDRGSDRLARLVTRQIRVWQPELLFAAASNEAGLDEILQLTVAQAASKAGERGAYPEQLAVARLSPWRATKVMRVAPKLPGGAGESASQGVQIDPAEPLPALSSSISSRVAEARTYLLRLGDELGRPSVCQPLSGGMTSTILGDLSIPRAGASRRAATTAAADAQWLTRRAATHHNIQMLLARFVQRQRAAGSAEQLAPLVRDLGPQEQTRLLFSIAGQFHSAGSTGVALETIKGILQRQNEDTTHHAATLQKLKWSTSVEVQHLLRNQTRVKTPNPGQFAGTSAANDVPMQQVSATTAPAATLKKLLRDLPPAARASEWVQMAEAASRREGASAADRLRIYERLRKTLPNGNWRGCATTEMWLADPKPDPRKPVPSTIRQIGFASDPPKLDGVLAEDFWQDAAVVTLEPLLGSRTPMPAAQVRLARDDRYFYLAIECQVANGTLPKVAALGGRQRDADLSDRDRVEISIDVNRDYASGWHLTVDDRGWAKDACQRDPSWNPRWHIARQASENAWTIEAAMPWHEIVPPSVPRANSPSAYSVWLLGIRRVMPRLGVATWPTSAQARPGWEQCGYLLVEQPIHQSP